MSSENRYGGGLAENVDTDKAYDTCQKCGRTLTAEDFRWYRLTESTMLQRMEQQTNVLVSWCRVCVEKQFPFLRGKKK
jgi:hypothetical protein